LQGAIGCHEPGQHWGNQLGGVADGMTAFSGEHFRIGDEVAMHGRRQLKRDF